MKAEHRKELETNALADRMGRLLGNLKEKPQKRTVTWVFLGALVVVVVFLSMRWYRVGREEDSDAWYNTAVYSKMYELGDVNSARAAAKAVLETNYDKIQGQALRFDLAWEQAWSSLRKLGVDPRGAKTGLLKAKEDYEALAKELENDAVLAPEAMYALAVIEETLAVENRSRLDSAKDLYEDVAKKHPDSAYGQLAAKRVTALTEDKTRKEITDLYQELDGVIGMGRLERLDGLLNPKNLLDPNKK